MSSHRVRVQCAALRWVQGLCGGLWLVASRLWGVYWAFPMCFCLSHEVSVAASLIHVLVHSHCSSWCCRKIPPGFGVWALCQEGSSSFGASSVHLETAWIKDTCMVLPLGVGWRGGQRLAAPASMGTWRWGVQVTRRCQQQEAEGCQGMRYETAWFLDRSRTYFFLRRSTELHFSLFGADWRGSWDSQDKVE